MLPRGEILRAISYLYRIPYSEAGGIRLRRGLRLGRFRLGTPPFRYQITRLDPARCCAAGSGGNQNLTIPHLDNVQHTFAHPGSHVLPRGEVLRASPYPHGVPYSEPGRRRSWFRLVLRFSIFGIRHSQMCTDHFRLSLRHLPELTILLEHRLIMGIVVEPVLADKHLWTPGSHGVTDDGIVIVAGIVGGPLRLRAPAGRPQYR